MRLKQYIEAISLTRLVIVLFGSFIVFSCSDYNQKDYKDNTPTSGKLKVYFDEGLTPHIKNQALTFESQYRNATLEIYPTSETEAVQALYNDSCELIVISRDLTSEEKKAFASKKYSPKFSVVAKSGIAVITNYSTALNFLSLNTLRDLLLRSEAIKDTAGKDLNLQILFDRNNSSIVHYILDSILRTKSLSQNANVLGSTIDCINYVAKTPNALAFVDFAYLSDVDDSIYKANEKKLKFVGISLTDTSDFALPGQSSFKLNTYPLTRNVYVFRKTGDFTLAKGFEGFMAGPKGQLTFLKQGLLPTRQSERKIHVNMEQAPDE